MCVDGIKLGMSISEKTSKVDAGKEGDELKMESGAANEFDPHSSLPRFVSG
jgi:hypothetical protein